MGGRLSRVGKLTVLLAALSFGLHAAAATLQTVHLEPARLFNPVSESLLGPFDADVRGMSLFSQNIFHVASNGAPFADQLADFLGPATDETARTAEVNLNGVARVHAFVPSPGSGRVTVPDLAAPAQSALTTPVGSVASPVQAPPEIAQSTPHYGTYTEYSPATQSMALGVSVPVRVGKVHFNGLMSTSQEQSLQSDAFRAMQVCGTTDENAACPYLRDSNSQSVIAGTQFDVRAGSRNVGFQLSSSLAHISTGDAAIYPYIPVDPDAQLTQNFDTAGPDASVLQYAGLADVVKHGVGASVDVPVTSRLSVGLQYNHAHYQGDYGTALLPGVDAYKDTYLGNVSYQLPNTNSMITLSARQYRYQDSLSNFNLTQTRADLNFTVKF